MEMCNLAMIDGPPQQEMIMMLMMLVSTEITDTIVRESLARHEIITIRVYH